MPRPPQVFRYRDDPVLDQQMKPIRTAFFSEDNIKVLKLDIDRLGAAVDRGGLLDRMETTYISDDDVQRFELAAASGEILVSAMVERLNRSLLFEIQRSLLWSATEFQSRFRSDLAAFLGDDLKVLYDFYGDQDNLQRNRQYARDANELDNTRFLYR